MGWTSVCRMGVAVCFIAAVLSVGVTSSASGQGQGATVLQLNGAPDCFFEPGDVAGVDVQFDARCTIVFTPSGGIQIVAHGQLPAGYTLDTAVRGELPCFEFGNGQIVATPSGRVSATCHFGG